MRQGLPPYVYERWQGELAFHNQDQVANPMTEHEADSVEIPARVSRALVWENRAHSPMIRFADAFVAFDRSGL